MTHGAGDEPVLLPCGRDPVEVAEHAVAGRLDEHERDCPYCREATAAALLSARLATGATEELDDVEPPLDLVPRVMRSVRTELRHAREIPLPAADGPAFVTDHVLATVLRDRLDDAGGLRVSSCRVEVRPGVGLLVRLEAYARYLQDLTAGADAGRRVVTAVLDEEFGLSADGGIDVDVVDLIGPAS